MVRPTGLLYTVDETPPPGVLVLSVAQHVALIANSLIFPVLLAREAGLSSNQIQDSVSLAMLALGVATILLCMKSRFLGSGYLSPAGYTPIYFEPSLYALQHGGLALVYGMTAVSGLVQLGIAPLLRRLRALFPPEIAGLVVAIAGLSLAVLGARYSLGIRSGNGVQPAILAVAGVSLVTMLGLNIWTKGYPRMFCMMIGAVVGSATSTVLGQGEFWIVAFVRKYVLADDFVLFRVPSFDHVAWNFDASLLVPFAVVALAGTLNLMGNVSTAQKINNSTWVRPEFKSLSGGLASSGLATVFCGFVGSPGVNCLASSIGLSSATGITSRSLGYWVGAAMVLFAFFPILAGLFVTTPDPVVGASLFFSSAFIFTNGLQMITSRMLDPRKIFVIGFSFAMAVFADIYHDEFATAPAALQPLVGNSVVLGTACAMLLNLIMRIGVRQSESLRLAFDAPRGEVVEQFLSDQGARWGARREIVSRATFGVVQVLEVIGQPPGGVEIEAGFDEFNLDIRVRYAGVPLSIPETKPTPREIVSGEDGERLLAGYLLRRNADAIVCKSIGGRTEVHLHYDH
jgi:NCS2 family nucleobase:cation symporter-2